MKKILLYILTILFMVSMAVAAGGNGCGEKVDITLTPAESTLVEGESVEFTANSETEGKIYWSASDLGVVSITSDGNKATVTALKAGSATVSATLLNTTATAAVTVTAKEVGLNDVEFNLNLNSVSLYLGQSVTVTGSLTVNGAAESVTPEFRAADADVVTVGSDGKITPVGIGSTTVDVTVNFGGKEYTESVAVTVRENILIAFSQPNIEIDALTDDAPTVTAVECSVYKNDEKIPGATFVWSSEDESVAQVSNDGTITAVSAGKTVITARYEEGGKEYFGRCSVVVNYNKVNLPSEEVLIDLSEGTDGKIVIEPLTGMSGEQINFGVNSQGAEWEINSTEIVLEISKLIRGVNDYKFYTDTREYSVSLYCADQLIKSGDDFLQMLENQTVLEAINKGNDKKLFVLANDITLNNTKRINNSNLYYGYSGKEGTNYFVDIFDGNGHKISSVDKNSSDVVERYIWTNGLFGYMANATVKNLIVENALLVDNGFSAVGTIAQQIQGESVVENCVIINSTVKAAGSRFSAGLLAGRVYNTNNDDLIIKNNLVVDGQENPSFISYNRKTASGETVVQYYYGGDYNSLYTCVADGDNLSVLCNFYAAIGDTALYSTNSDIYDNYCLSTHGYLNATNPNAVNGVWFEEERMKDGKVYLTVEDFITDMGDAITEFGLLSVSDGKLYAGGNRITLREPVDYGDNDGNFNPDWAA